MTRLLFRITCARCTAQLDPCPTSIETAVAAARERGWQETVDGLACLPCQSLPPGRRGLRGFGEG